MEIKRKELLAVLQKCMPGVETGNALLEGADTFIFNGGRVYTYNDHISVAVPFQPEVPAELVDAEPELSGAVKAKEFFALINKLSGDVIKFAQGDGVWVIKAAGAKAELTLLGEGVMDRIKDLATSAEWLPLPDNFLEGLSQCRFNANRSALSGIVVRAGVMVSTDEMRINYFKLAAPIGPFWIAQPAANELGGIRGLKDYALTDAWAHFRAEDGLVFSCKRLAHDKFPFEKIEALVSAHEKAAGDMTSTLPKDLVPAVERAAALAMDIDSHDTVRLTFTPEYIEVYSQRSTGKYSEKVAWETPPEGTAPPTALYVDHSMVSYGLKRSTSFYIKHSEKSGKAVNRLVFVGDNIKHLMSTFMPEQ